MPIPEVASLPPLVRSRLAEHWTEAARMEHASIGAFARFVLQLMALGAPPDLVVDAQRAMEDETRHARLAFGMGSAYAGADIGPGRLAADGCLDTMDLRSILEHLADRDPAVAAVLATLAADEARHAELAWRSVAWMLTAFGHAARDALQEALREALTEARRPAGRSDADGSLLEYGVLTEGERATLQGEALRAVVLPLARALLGGREEDRDPDPDPDPDPRGRGQRGRGSVPTSPRGTLPLPCRHGAITPCVPS